MKKIILSIFLLLAFAVPIYAVPTQPMEVTEVDGSPKDTPYRITFPNGTLTCAAGVCTYAPSATSATFTDFYLAGPDVTHGMTSIAATSDYLAAFQIGSSGGADIYGMTEADQAGALRLTGVIGATDPTDIYPALIFRGGKKNGTGWQALAAAETAFMFYNYTTPIGTAYGNGEWIFPSLQNTPIGSTIASTGAFTSVVIGTSAYNPARGIAKLNLTSDTAITEAQINASYWISNQGASGEVDVTLPAVSYAIAVGILVEEAQVFEINPPSGEAFSLNSDGAITAMDADDVIDSPATVGSKMVCTRMQAADASWHWSCDAVRGSWADSGASD